MPAYRPQKIRAMGTNPFDTSIIGGGTNGQLSMVKTRVKPTTVIIGGKKVRVGPNTTLSQNVTPKISLLDILLNRTKQNSSGFAGVRG